MFLMAFVQVGVLAIAFQKLELSAHSAYLLFATILAGSMVNVPLFRMKGESPGEEVAIHVNVGGCVVPVAFCIYLMGHHPLDFFRLSIAVLLVSLLCYRISRQVPGVGIGMPVFLAPIAAATVSYLLDAQDAPSLAYISGTLGVLIGSDLFHLEDLRKMGAPYASIGGAGSFDGIFITGIVAVLLA
ncbi:MAG: DUF1614 domain-containing protein [Burkholderiales bacterium]|nr:DUF1614 domain-containing protein [Burkholderiales bacterium]